MPRLVRAALPAFALAALGGGAALLMGAGEPAHAGAGSDGPAVVELFQSQGCSSCPPAAAVVNALADRPDVLALSFEVTYWDQLGWKDIFARPAYTARQWDYAHAARRGNVYTPQVIVNGRTALVGNVKGEVETAIARTPRAPGGPAIGIEDGTISLAAATTSQKATVWLIRFDPRTIAVPVRAGENAGRTLPHRNVVRDLVKLGEWQGRAARYDLPAGAPGLASAVLVQSGAGGPIIAARRL